MSEWKTPESAPLDGTIIEVRVPVIMRWNAYKPNSEQRKKGIKGRWQQLNAYGGWDNCEPPGFEWRLVLGGDK